MSDDLGMKALSERFTTAEATVRAITAGCDAVLMCGDSQEPQFAALEALVHAAEDRTLPLKRIEDALGRHRRVKERFLAPPHARPLQGRALRALLGSDEHQAVAAEMARFASCLLRPALRPLDLIAIVAPASAFALDQLSGPRRAPRLA